MTVPYSLLIIKSMSVGRGDAPFILQDILDHCPVALRMFRSFVVCDNTLVALTQPVGPHLSTLDYEQEKIHPPRQIHSWVCIFTHLDRATDPIPILNDYCGPLDKGQQVQHHLRFRYGGSNHSTDTCVHLTAPERLMYEAKILFIEFDDSKI